MRRVRPMLVVLALAHLAMLAGVIAATVGSFPLWLQHVVVAVPTSQLCLVGIWAGVGRTRGVVRLVLVCLLAWAVGAAAAVSAIVQRLASQQLGTESVGWVVGRSLAVAAPLLTTVAVSALPLVWLRSRGRRLVGFGSQAPPARSLPVQFSIRHVLIATVALALLLAAGQFTRSAGTAWEDGGFSFRDSGSGVGAVLEFLFLLSGLVYLGAVPITTVWACLGRERPAPRLLLVLLLVLAAAACPLHAFGGIRHLEFALMMVLYFGILAASLLVFRRLGYRWITAEALWECSLPSADELRRPVAGPPASGVSPFRPPDSPGRQGP